MRGFTAILLLFYFANMWCGPTKAAEQVSESNIDEVHYLAFQVFTAAQDTRVASGSAPLLGAPPIAATLDAFAADVITRIGDTGNVVRRLALIFGPIAFDHDDDEVASLISTAFDIALARDIAVGFHIDDSMFWGRRTDLLSDTANVERAGWNGPRSTGRRLDWGPSPSHAPPQMCINSPAIEAAVHSRGTLIGGAIRQGIERLKTHTEKISLQA